MLVDGVVTVAATGLCKYPCLVAVKSSFKATNCLYVPIPTDSIYIVAALAAVIIHFLPEGGGGSEPPPSTTTTTTTSSSSTSCSPTMSPTAMVILTTEDTTDAQYKDLVLSLPDSTNNVEIIYEIVNFRVLVADVDDCDIKRLWDNPIVEAMSLEGPYILDDEADDLPVTTKRESLEVVRQEPKHITKDLSNGTADLLDRRVLNPLVDLNVQQNSPWHLKLLSGLSHQVGGTLAGLFYDFEDYLYADRSTANNSPTSEVTVYVLDTGIRATHDASTRILFIITN